MLTILAVQQQGTQARSTHMSVGPCSCADCDFCLPLPAALPALLDLLMMDAATLFMAVSALPLTALTDRLGMAERTIPTTSTASIAALMNSMTPATKSSVP